MQGFDWKGLPADALVVDVGGGIGSQSLHLAKSFNHLKFIVQDRPAVLDAANQVIQRYNLEMILIIIPPFSSGGVRCQTRLLLEELCFNVRILMKSSAR